MNDSSDEDKMIDLPIVRDFDKLCFEFGDRDAILSHGSTSISYFELQEHSKVLAYQIYYRFGWPDYILLDCQESPAAEAVATLACMRIRRPFVPVSSMDQHRPGRMNIVVNLLKTRGKQYSCREYDESKPKKETSGCHDSPSIVAVVVCENDRDPLLSVFQQTDVHRILYLDTTGGIRECLSVPETFRLKDIETSSSRDDMYVMFTSGTTTKSESAQTSSAKAVVGSHSATHARLRWFLNTFSSSSRIGRRTKLTFVDGVTELWGGLLDPMNVIVCVPPIELRARGVVALAEDMNCTQLLLLPSQANQLLLASPKSNPFSNLDRIIVSGEVCPPVLWEQFQIRYPKTQLINLYGQTETTGDCLYAVLTDIGEAAVVENIVAVGKPISLGFHISVLDDPGDNDYSSAIQTQRGNDEQHIQKKFEHKQLVIMGSSLSNGYLGGSSSGFDEFRPGDVGFCHDGLWYVSGRIDEVRKINGVLTSPSEIESTFCKTYNLCDYVGVVAVIIENETYLLCTNEDVANRFSRQHMREVGVPFNLIPKKVLLVPSIPRSTSGAKKVDRKACLKLAQSQNRQHRQTPVLSNSDKAHKRKSERTVFPIIATVLGINECDLDSKKSFLEVGGDSASSITLLYRLKQEVRHVADLTATDILWCENLDEIERLVLGVIDKPKRPKQETRLSSSTAAESKKIVPKVQLQIDSWHRSISFQACVDSTPIIIGKSVISACHGGVIAKFSSINCDIEGHCHYLGWMFQADLVLIKESKLLLVSGYSTSNKGIVICLTSDLQIEKWRIELDDPIKSRPVVIRDEVWVLSGQRLVGLGLLNGLLLGRDLKLPRSPCVSNPTVISRQDERESIIFASSDWEGGVILVDTQKMESNIYVDGEIGPVHKHMSTTDSLKGIFLSDIYGSLHLLTVSTMKVRASIQLSSNPLSTATVIDKNMIIVGSYSGILFGVKYDEQNCELEKQWECNCHSSIYSKPLKFGETSIVVCTTAGYFLKISIQNGVIQSFRRISAEIWSSPVQIGQSNLVAVGARDSRCHLVSI